MTTETSTAAAPLRQHVIRRSYVADAAFVIMLPVVMMILVLVASCGYDSSAPYQQPPPPPPPTAEGLWMVPSSNPSILQFAPSQLLASGGATPATRITTPSASLIDVNAVAFDTDGTLWVASADDSSIIALAPAALAPSGSRQATIIIKSNAGSLDQPTGIAFDSQHRLWVGNTGNGTIVRFDRTQIAASGAPVPAQIISGAGTPTALAFDAAGDLWVSNINANKVFSYSPAQLATSGILLPHVVINTLGVSLHNPTGIAFDAAGNLWVANLTTRTVVAYAAAQLTTTGTPAPQITLGSTAGSLDLPAGLTFDAAGSLWVLSAQGALEKFPHSALAASGSPAPTVTLRLSPYVLFWSAAFWPKPAGLPIN